MKSKMIYAVISFTALFLIGINVTKAPPVKSSQEIDALVKSVINNKSSSEIVKPSLPTSDEKTVSIDMEKAAPDSGEVVQSEDGKMVVKGVLPPELIELNSQLMKIDKSLEVAIAQDNKKIESEEIQLLIQNTDALISRTNQSLGIEKKVESTQ